MPKSEWPRTALEYAVARVRREIGPMMTGLEVTAERAWHWGKRLRLTCGGYGHLARRKYAVHPGGMNPRCIVLARIVACIREDRILTSQEQVHHIDGDRTNDHPDNLEVCPSGGDHRRAHHATGGQTTGNHGLLVYSSGPNRYRPVARVVAEALVGHPLDADESVYSRDGDPSNVALQNLLVARRGTPRKKLGLPRVLGITGYAKKKR